MEEEKIFGKYSPDEELPSAHFVGKLLRENAAYVRRTDFSSALMGECTLRNNPAIFVLRWNGEINLSFEDGKNQERLTIEEDNTGLFIRSKYIVFSRTPLLGVPLLFDIVIDQNPDRDNLPRYPLYFQEGYHYKLSHAPAEPQAYPKRTIGELNLNYSEYPYQVPSKVIFEGLIDAVMGIKQVLSNITPLEY